MNDKIDFCVIFWKAALVSATVLVWDIVCSLACFIYSRDSYSFYSTSWLLTMWKIEWEREQLIKYHEKKIKNASLTLQLLICRPYLFTSLGRFIRLPFVKKIADKISVFTASNTFNYFKAFFTVAIVRMRLPFIWQRTLNAIIW